jgi:hypothetical protein
MIAGRSGKKIQFLWVLALFAIVFASVTPSVHASGGMPVDLPVRLWMDPALPAEDGSQMRLVAYVEDPGVYTSGSRPAQSSTYDFGNPAGCVPASSLALSPEEMLANVQAVLGSAYSLSARRQTWIWNGELGSMQDVSQERFVYEFVFNEFAPPLTYLGDHVASVFLTSGFVIWFRQYSGSFRLLAIPMTPGVEASDWAGYLSAYWQPGGLPQDAFVFPVLKKLPCQWAVDQGYVSRETLTGMFSLDWHMPEFLPAGRQYLASTCKEANRISRELIDYWDASSMCGPLTWTILRDADAFPYRIGAWTASAAAFTASNPRWNAQPWATFDPETYDLLQIKTPMPGYDFARHGDLHTGDIVYSFSTLYVTPGVYDHIFLVAGVDDTGARLSVTNMVHTSPGAECSISEVRLYTPGDRETGVINHEWNGFGYGRTGTTGFDIFRWNWTSYHLAGAAHDHTVRWGETLETIAFDWKVSPESILAANQLTAGTQLLPGQTIHLPVPPAGFE